MITSSKNKMFEGIPNNVWSNRVSLKSDAGLTLIELLVVIGIVAALSTTVILAINPSSILKESRDATRLAEVASIDKAIGFSITQNPDLPLGSSSTVYTSLIDDDGTPDCDDYLSALPPLVSPWQYRCVAKADLRKINGTGWIPIDFQSLGIVPLDSLPVDRINTAQSGLYYTYVPGGSWEINTQMESAKYQWGGPSDKESTDGGNTIVLYEKGSNLNVAPKEINARIIFEVRTPESCWDGDEMGGPIVTYYPLWATPGSGLVALIGLSYWNKDGSLSQAESLKMAVYNGVALGSKISEDVIVDGSSTPGWVSGLLSVPIPVTLGTTYAFGIANITESTFNLPRDASGNCVSYLPNSPSFVSSIGTVGLLEPALPNFNYLNKTGFVGVVYATN